MAKDCKHHYVTDTFGHIVYCENCGDTTYKEEKKEVQSVKTANKQACHPSIFDTTLDYTRDGRYGGYVRDKKQCVRCGEIYEGPLH